MTPFYATLLPRKLMKTHENREKIKDRLKIYEDYKNLGPKGLPPRIGRNRPKTSENT